MAEANGEVAALREKLAAQKDSTDQFKAEVREDQKERHKLDLALYERLGGLNARVGFMLTVMTITLTAVIAGVIGLVLKK